MLHSKSDYVLVTLRLGMGGRELGVLGSGRGDTGGTRGGQGH